MKKFILLILLLFCMTVYAKPLTNAQMHVGKYYYIKWAWEVVKFKLIAKHDSDYVFRDYFCGIPSRDYTVDIRNVIAPVN